MELIDRLERKVRDAASEVTALRRARRELQLEVEQLREALRGHQTAVRENEKFRRDHDRLRARLTRLNGKLEKLLLLEPTPTTNGGNREDHPQ